MFLCFSKTFFKQNKNTFDIGCVICRCRISEGCKKQLYQATYNTQSLQRRVIVLDQNIKYLNVTSQQLIAN